MLAGRLSGKAGCFLTLGGGGAVVSLPLAPRPFAVLLAPVLTDVLLNKQKRCFGLCFRKKSKPLCQ